jgi:hypothetical protein
MEVVMRRRIALSLALALAGCTQQAPWFAEGTVGHTCFPDGTCDPGLRCVAKICTSDTILADARVERKNRDARVDRARDQGCPTIAAPTLLSYPVTTAQVTVPIRGQAPGATEVRISGGATPQTGGVVGGAFCVEVSLTPKTLNGLEVVARDAAGCTSSATHADITNSEPGPINLFFGKPVISNYTPSSGTLGMLTDGQLTASVKLSFWDPDPWPGVCNDKLAAVHVDIGATEAIDQVVAKYPVKSGFKSFATCWELWVSTKSDPDSPSNQSDTWKADWTMVKQNLTQTAGDLTIFLFGTKARHVALLLFEDDATSMTETFELTEVEAWAQQPAPPPDTCP